MKVLVTIRLPEEVLTSIVRCHQVEVYSDDQPMNRQKMLESIGGKDGLLCTITDRIDEEVLERAPDLKVIANYGVGFDHINVQAASRRGILISNTPGVLTDATADLTFALILSVSRRVIEGDKMTRDGRFRFWAPFHFLGCEVTGKTLGIIGFGRIGRAVAKRAAGFNMKTLYYTRTPLWSSPEEDRLATFAPLETLLRESDFITLHVPLTAETRHMIGRPQLEIMKPSAYLINTARGPVVNEKALVEALKNGKILGAGLDVYENEPQLSPGLLDLDNVVLLPHMGSATIETRTRMAAMAAENILAGLSGKRPPNCIN